jgi:hypothetical protein
MSNKILARAMVVALAAIIGGCVDNSGNGNFHPTDAQGVQDTQNANDGAVDAADGSADAGSEVAAADAGAADGRDGGGG